MRPAQKNLRFRWILSAALAAGAVRGAESSRALEIYPYFGGLLPSGIDGLTTSATGLGLRANYMVAAPGALEVGAFFWRQPPDSGRVLDVGMYYELAEEIRPFFSAGMHYSTFHIPIKYDSGGGCRPSDCRTDEGSKLGLYAGGGIIFPLLDNTPVKAGLRFYKGPGYWVLIDVGMAFRF